MKRLNIQDIINNAVDEMNRAIDKLKECGTFLENTLTDDDILIDDMKNSIERLTEINDIIGLALIIAPSVGHQIYENDLMQKSNFKVEPDSIEMRENYLKWAMDILPTCQEYKWEDYYDVAWRKADEEAKKIIEKYKDLES